MSHTVRGAWLLGTIIIYKTKVCLHLLASNKSKRLIGVQWWKIQSLLWFLQSWLFILRSGNPITIRQSEVVTICLWKIPRNFTLPGILVLVSRSSCPAAMSLMRDVSPESANLSTSTVSRQIKVDVPLAGISPGWSRASPTSFPWCNNLPSPSPLLKLAWFRFWIRRVRLRVMFSSTFMAGKEILGATPSKEADTTWVLASLTLKTVTPKIIPTSITVNKSRRVVKIATLHLRCLCFGWSGCEGEASSPFPFSWVLKVMVFSFNPVIEGAWYVKSKKRETGILDLARDVVLQLARVRVGYW